LIKDIDPKEPFSCTVQEDTVYDCCFDIQARGFRNFKEIEGGFNAIAKTELPKTDFVCQTKIL
jgi:hypothetical protein